MKLFLLAIRWIIGSFLCLVSIGGFIVGDYFLAFIMLSIGIIFIPLTAQLFYKNSKKGNQSITNKESKISIKNEALTTNVFPTQNKESEKLTFNSSNLIIEQIGNKEEILYHKDFLYLPFKIQNEGLQLLESIAIIYNTKNLDTLIGRYAFILTIYQDFIYASNNNRFIFDVQASIDQYKIQYYDKKLNDFEIKLVTNPNINSLNLFYCRCLCQCFDKFYEEQISQILNLKKEDAKERRINKIVIIGNETIIELQKFNLTEYDFNSNISQIRDMVEKLNKSKKSNNNVIKEFKNKTILNSNSAFPITVYNSEINVIKKIINIIKSKENYNKTGELLPIFSLHDSRCKEVDEYLHTYKPIFEKQVSIMLSNNEEYNIANHADRIIIELEVKEKAIAYLPERADCDLVLLFNYLDIDFNIDNELVNKYGYNILNKYFRFSYSNGKIISGYDRKDFEELISAGLVYTNNELDIDEILTIQSLKTLNSLCKKEEGFFKRKIKAIEYIKLNSDLFSNVVNILPIRNLFKLKEFPSEFKNLDIESIKNHWLFLEEYIKLIVETYEQSTIVDSEISDTKSWVNGYSIEKNEDFNSDFICLRARDECKKKYSKSNPPKIPFHVGCNCNLKLNY